MPESDYLKEYFAQLSDDELLAQVVEERLTEEAAPWARKELASRGIAVDEAAARVREKQSREALQERELGRKRHEVLRRMLRFPLRAALGVEAPWPVLFSGAAIAYLSYRAMVAVAIRLLGQRPVPAYALAASFAALIVFEAICAWFVVSLWRCAPRAGSGWRSGSCASSRP